MPAPVLPLVVEADDGLHVFASVAALLGYVEAIDVAEGVYTAYDAFGRRLPLAVEAAPYRALFGLVRGVGEVVVVGPPEDAPEHAGRLRQLLVETLDRLGVRHPGRGAPLDALVTALLGRVGFTGGRS
jgi:hypothetical protein